MHSEQIDKLAEALSKAQGEMQNAKKDSQNPFYKSPYANLASSWNACREPLSKNALAVTQTVDILPNGEIVLRTTLFHASGQWIASTYPVSPIKRDPQAIGSAITYARRYQLNALVGIAAQEKEDKEDRDEDDDGNYAMGLDKQQENGSNNYNNPKAVISPKMVISPKISTPWKFDQDAKDQFQKLCSSGGFSGAQALTEAKSLFPHLQLKSLTQLTESEYLLLCQTIAQKGHIDQAPKIDPEFKAALDEMNDPRMGR